MQTTTTQLTDGAEAAWVDVDMGYVDVTEDITQVVAAAKSQAGGPDEFWQDYEAELRRIQAKRRA